MLGALTVIQPRSSVCGPNWHTAEHSFWLGRSARKMFPKFPKTVGILSLSIVVVLLGRIFGETVLASLPQFVQRLRPRIEVTSNDQTIAFFQKYYFEINVIVLILAVILFILLRLYRDYIRNNVWCRDLRCVILVIMSPFVFWIYCKIFSKSWCCTKYTYASYCYASQLLWRGSRCAETGQLPLQRQRLPLYQRPKRLSRAHLRMTRQTNRRSARSAPPRYIK